MSEFVVVSKASKDDTEYDSAVVFNSADKDADNEGAAKAFMDEVKRQRPYQSHSVVSREDFDNQFTDGNKEAAPAAPAAPAPEVAPAGSETPPVSTPAAPASDQSPAPSGQTVSNQPGF